MCHMIPISRKTTRWQVPHDPDQLSNDHARFALNAQSSMISWSLREPSPLDAMVQFPQAWLVLRLPPAKPVDADLVAIQVHLYAHQAMQPVRVHLEAPAQHLHYPHRTGPPPVDDPAPGSRLEVQAPAFREGTPRGADSMRSAWWRRSAVT